MSDPSFEEQELKQANDLVRKRQRYFRRPKTAKNILAQLMARKGYGQDQSQNELESIWNEVVGARWVSTTQIGTIRNGVLEIFVSNSSVNQQLTFKKLKLLSEIQARVPKHQIKEIRFRVGNGT